MRSRAGTVGRTGLGPLLGRLAAQTPELRLHLVAHSVGARVAAHALIALAEGGRAPATPLKSVTLLQATLSHHIFAPERRGVLAGVMVLVDGPIVVTYSRNDSAARTSTVATAVVGRDDDAPGESASERGALGYDGAQAVNARHATLGRVGTVYPFVPGGIYNVDASNVIRSHSDVVSPEIAWLILSAAGTN
jgi:esterase/lipase superfamily enzyme